MKKKLKELTNKVNLRKKGSSLPVDNAPRITNDTVAAHRDEVLANARKYILPLQQSKHRIVVVSTGLFLLSIVVFMTYCTLALYRFQTNSTFLYRVTQVIPFPIARIGPDFVAYENYLFELRHYVHYYDSQVNVDFNDERYRDQLVNYKAQAYKKVIDDAYVKKLAKANGISVTEQEVSAEVELLRSQNRLGSTDQGFEDVLRDYFGWSLEDFKRSIRQDLLAKKVVAKFDTETQARANAAMNEIKAGGDFAAIAKKYSDDPATKENGGDLGVLIDRNSRELAPEATDALFKLKPGETSEIINTGSELMIVKNLETNGEKIRAAQIVFAYTKIDTFLNDIKDQQKTKNYIKVSPPTEAQPAEPTE